MKKFPEFQELQRRFTDSRISNEEHYDFQVLYNKYSDSYDAGYEEGQKAAKTLVTTKLEIKPDSFTMGAHTSRNLHATLVFSNGPPKDVSGESTWQSSAKDVVEVTPSDGIAYSFMLKPGRAEVTVSYNGIHGVKDAKITIVVNPPTIVLNPENPTMKVGEKQRFRAYSVDKNNDALDSELDSTLLYWDSDDKKRIAVDAEGNATVLAAGPPVKIRAAYRNSPVQANTTITVK